MSYFDSHCHLQFEKLAGDLAGVVDRAKSAGVDRMICVGTSLPDSQDSIDIAAKYSNVWASAGAHPHNGKDFPKDGERVLAELLKQPKVVAVGEIGLDYYKDYSPRENQQDILRRQIEAGLPSGLPFIFHVRDAWNDFWPIFDDYKNIRGVIHSFSASRAELDEVLKRGLYVGLNGIMTFTKEQAQLEAAKAVPLDKLMLETDAPFLAPAGHRGEVCEPKHVKNVAEFLAELRGENLEDLESVTTKNAEELFGL